MLMNRRNSLLMIIDVQERLAPAMDDPRQVISNSARLVGAAKAMGVPFVITEQYPKGLGQTMIDVRQEPEMRRRFFQSCIFLCPRTGNYAGNTGVRAQADYSCRRRNPYLSASDGYGFERAGV